MPVSRDRRRGARFAGALALGLAMALLGAAVPQPAWAQAGGTMQASPTETGGRIVFEWPQPVRQNAVIGGKILVITFGEPFGGDPQTLTVALPGIVDRVDGSRDGRVITVVLRDEYRLDRRVDGSSMTLTLTRPGATPAPAAAAPAVETRHGRHDDFDRLVFAWPATVEYQVRDRPDGATIVFQRSGRVELDALRRDLAGTGIEVEVVPAEGQLAVRLGFAEDRSMTHFRDGAAVVVDVGHAPPPAQPEPEPETGQADAGTDEPADQPEPQAEAPAPGDNAPEPPMTAVPGDAAGQPTPPPAAESEVGAAVADGEQHGPPLTVELSRSGGRAELSLDFGSQVPAAVFRRAGAVWAVFGAARTLALPDAAATGAAIFELKQLPHKRAAVLRIAAGPEVVPAVSRDGGTWTLTLGDGTLAPERAAAVESEPHAISGGRLTVKGPGGAPVRLRDPQAGDDIIVVPFDAAGLGVQPGRHYAQMRLLPTVQGVAIEPLADGVTVISDGGGVRITTANGLNLSPRARATGSPSSFDGARIFEFGDWLGGQAGAFPAAFERVKQNLLYRIAVASEAERNLRRLDLARFYFAHGLGADASAVLGKAVEDDEQLLDRPEIRALRGAARLLTRNFAAAAEDLNHAGLDAEPEIALWRGALAAEQRNWRSAVANFAQGEGLLRFYPRTLKLAFGLLAAEAELKAGDGDRARMFLAMIEDEAPTGRTRQEVAYLRGVALEQSGQYEAALDQWRQLIERGDGPSRVKAAVSSIGLERSRGTIQDLKSAIEQLDRLRFAWRGDALEFAVLRQLGNLYLADSQYRLGFETLNRAARLYPGEARDQSIGDDMREAFAELFLEDAASALSPIKALALFDDYKALMPADARGDEMIANLVDRLVAVDLLGRAANLLTQQIETRLNGIERARVGARLALVLLLDDQPRRAVNALEATRVEGMPAELVAQRTRLAARSFAEMGRRDRALELLAGDTTDEAEYIRLDLRWRAQEWGKAAEVLSQLADRIDVPSEGPLGEEQSRVVLRLAVALALAGDRSGLAYLRTRFDGAMAQGPYREAYAILTREMERDGAVSYQTVEATIRDADHYHAFMASYRERLQAGGLSTIN